VYVCVYVAGTEWMCNPTPNTNGRVHTHSQRLKYIEKRLFKEIWNGPELVFTELILQVFDRIYEIAIHSCIFILDFTH
jgi:hypothetical protein